MTTDNDDDMREGGARIEDLPASDLEVSAQDRERPSPLRAPPDATDPEPDDPEDLSSPSPPPDPTE